MFHYPGARKKKSLTDFVDIIPFKDQIIKDLPKKNNLKSEIKENSKEFLLEKEESRVMKTPSGKMKTTSLSIKQMIQKKEKEDTTKERILDINKMPQQKYSIHDLKIAWKKFAYKMKDRRKETIYNALIKREPKQISDNEYALVVDNQVQIDYIKPFLGELIDYIRAEVKNYLIDLKMEVSQDQKIELKFQTGKDKFTSLAKKNPNLHTLKDKFNLDIEY